MNAGGILHRLPKVEIHLHLEGAIPLPALWELIEKYGGTHDVPDLAALEEKFRYRDFPHFLSTWMWKNGFIREYDDFTFIAGAVAADLAAQNIRYVEAFHSPGDFQMIHGLDVARITEAVRRGLDVHRDAIDVRLIADLTRDFGPERGAVWLEELAASKEFRIIGIGIGGGEHDHPPEPYESVFERARALGLHTTAHAGEAAGPESVWGAINALRVERIGHGARAWEDDALVDYLGEHQVPIEMCPISNLRTGVVPTLTAHPIRTLFERGLLVSVNTDDPKMFGNSLEQEYQGLIDELDFTLDDIQKLLRHAIDSTWADASTKARLHNELNTFAAAN